MTRYNQKIHHRRSIRLKGYDYAQAGLYFITICCHNRKCLFGEIVRANNYLPEIETQQQSEMVLNDAGKIANDCWLEIPNHFPNAVLHKHIIMPNHVHGIIELTDATIELTDATIVGADVEIVGAENFLPLQNEFQKMIPRSIGSIVKGFKIGVTKWFRANTNIKTVWQRNYYEHIVRNEQSYQIISEYIINNPAKWANDKFYKK